MRENLSIIRSACVIAVAGAVIASIQAVNITLTLFAYNKFARLNVTAGISSLSILVASFLVARLIPLSRFKAFILHWLACLITLYYSLSIILLLYRIDRRFTFDFFFLWYNLSDTYKTLLAITDNLNVILTSSFVVLLIHYAALVVVYEYLGKANNPSKGRIPNKVQVPAYISAILLLLALQVNVENEIANLVREFFARKSEVRILYGNFYEDSINRNKDNKTIKPVGSEQRNLFLVHLESLNGHVVDRVSTPRFVTIAEKQGILFPRIQSSSVLTIRSHEVLLCSILPSLGVSLAQSESLTHGLECLPAILRKQGYKTIYFQSYPDFRFQNKDFFMRAIGFEEMRSRDIMKPGDRMLKWGYPEDLFYTRVFEYLEKYKKDKIFAYITVGSSNHYPFYGDEQKRAFPNFRQKVPFPEPRNFKERVASSTYIQDYFFGDMYEKLFRPQYGDNSNMIVFGDHSWPIEIHPGNRFNENQAYQENFVSSLVILPAKRSISKYSVGKDVAGLYSHLDILPTVLEMMGFKEFNYYGKSFSEELTNGNQTGGQDRCVLSVQPFSGGYISVINYPIKHIFNLKTERFSTYDLQRDPDEMRPVEESKIDKSKIGILRDCLNSIKNQQSGSAGKKLGNSQVAPHG